MSLRIFVVGVVALLGSARVAIAQSASALPAPPGTAPAPPATLLPPPGTVPAPPSAVPAVEPGVQRVSLDELLALLARRSPHIAAERAPIAVAEAGLVGAGAYPNPTLSYGVLAGIHGVEYVNGTQHTVMLEQPFLVAGQRGARREAAQADVGVARAEARAGQHELAARARSLFVTLLAAEQRIKLLEQAEADLERAERVVVGRQQGGVMSAYDQSRIELETQAVAARAAEARGELDDASGRMAGLLALPGWHPRANGSLADALGPEASAAPSIERVPAVVVAEKAAESARSHIELARAERWPNPSLGAGAAFTTSGYTLAGSFGIAMDLPLFDRGQGAIARARAEAHGAMLERDVVRAEAQAENERAARALATHRRALESYERTVVARLPELTRMAEAAYASGRGTILDLLDTLRTINETRLVELEYQEATGLSAVDLFRAEGRADDLGPARRAP